MFSVPGGLTHVITIENAVYFQSSDRIYSYQDETFELLTDSGPFKGFTSYNGNLVIFTPDQLIYVDAEGNILETITDPAFEDINEVVITDGGELWVGDDRNGLLSERNGEWLSFSPSGPVRSDMFSLQYSGREILAFTGGYGSVPFGRPGSYSAFNDGLWTNTSGLNISDVSDGVVLNNVTYLASAGSGMLQIAGESAFLFDETNSPLQTDAFGRLWVTALTAQNNEVYVVNHASPTPFHKWDGDSWESYDNLPGVARFALEAVILSDVAWMRILRSRGGGLQGINMESGETRYLSEEADQGSLASRNVFDLVIDKDGFLWLGTARGVSVLFNPLVLNGPINAVEPVFDGRPLLVDREVYAIAVDGGNRKWMGTDQGAWLFDPLADELILHFTSDNSPLPSNNVIDIAVDGETGEVFFLTDAGLASYRAAATEAGPEHESVKIFPNPVKREFQGTVGISGLSRDAIIKITDVSGKLVYQTQASGGTAAWPIRNSGNLSTGVYLVFSASEDGDETYVGKIAVIN
jgi:ligand-binding sensor domain-containing protein